MDKLDWINNIPRQVGSTTALLRGAGDNEAIMIVASQHIAASYQSKYNNIDFVSFQTANTYFLGRDVHKPILFDIPAVIGMVNHARNTAENYYREQIQSLNEKITSLESEVNTMKSCINNMKSLASIMRTVGESVEK